MPEASFGHCEGYLQSLQFPILMVRRLVLSLMNHHVSCWLTSIDPNNCFVFKTHSQHYISERRFLGMLLIIPGFFHVDPLRGIAKCTLGSYQFKLLHESVLFIELKATLIPSVWWGKSMWPFWMMNDFNMKNSILKLIAERCCYNQKPYKYWRPHHNKPYYWVAPLVVLKQKWHELDKCHLN